MEEVDLCKLGRRFPWMKRLGGGGCCSPCPVPLFSSISGDFFCLLGKQNEAMRRWRKPKKKNKKEKKKFLVQRVLGKIVKGL